MLRCDPCCYTGQKLCRCAPRTSTNSVFYQRCLRSIARVWWKHRISTVEIRKLYSEEITRPRQMSSGTMSGGASLFNKIDDVLLSKLESGQWRERGDTLDQIAKHLEIPVLPSGNYGPLIKALLQVVEADKNRQLVLRAVGILQQLAQGLRKSFVPHAERTLSVCLNRCKENNQGIVQALRSASQTVVDLATKCAAPGRLMFQ
ncbi:hypothetical protein T265_07057 [Opisthorchis viverrini]|uniref:TOG domain-containing protein n=1 Tax=Opisthorchis viverrini TaxID=6198 RepID=A0A074ZI61_OPIVI|nr:hypothetical protein T265_07057 [Opisthorchis viverrini]KER25487.1 hypothetical protein T265_07057 [Opisthorchis viverrini]